MRKLLLILAVLFPFLVMAQLSPITGGKIQNNTTNFGVGIAVGTTIHDLSTNKFYLCITPASSTENLTSALAKFRELSNPATVKDFGAKGDGTTDDITSIESALTSTITSIIFPSGTYIVSRTVSVPSNKTLLFEPGSILFLKSNSDTLLITNNNWISGNSNIIIQGGIFDGNGTNQTDKVGIGTNPNTYHGTLMRFQNVKNLSITNLTIKDPQWFGIHLGAVENFTVKDIIFDYRNKGGDCLHISGRSSNGYVQNLKDPFGAHDDTFVAIMSTDSPQFNITQGEIHHIVVDGLFTEDGGTYSNTNTFRGAGVDFLDTGDGIHDITVSNIIGKAAYAGCQFMYSGTFTTYAPSNIYNIQFNNIDITVPDNSAMGPILIGTNVKNLQINNIVYRPSGSTNISMIQLYKKALVDNLTLSNVSIIDSTTTGIWAGISIKDSADISSLQISNWYQTRSATETAKPVTAIEIPYGGFLGSLQVSNMTLLNSSESSAFYFGTYAEVGDVSISNSSFINVNNILNLNVENSGTSILRSLQMSNINYVPNPGTTEMLKFLYNTGSDTIHVRTSSLNVVGVMNAPITKYPETIKLRLNSTDFQVDTSLLTPRRNDIVLDHVIGPVIWSGTKWLKMTNTEGSQNPPIYFLDNQKCSGDTTLPEIESNGSIQVGTTCNPTVGLRIGTGKNYRPYIQGVNGSTNPLALLIQPLGGQVVIGKKEEVNDGSLLYVNGNSTLRNTTNVETLKINNTPETETRPDYGYVKTDDGVKTYPWPKDYKPLFINIQELGADTSGNSDCYDILMTAIDSLHGNPGVIFFPPGFYKVGSPIVIPNNGASPVGTQPSITLMGSNGTHGAASAHDGSTLYFDFVSSSPRLYTNGWGILKIQDLALYRGEATTGDAPTIYTTNTVLRLSNVGIYGYPRHCVNGLQLGGTGWGYNSTDTSMFGGYGTIIEGCWFDYTKASIRINSAGNSIVIKNNHFGYGCNGDAHIVINGYSHPWYEELNSGGDVSGNLFEMVDRKYGVWANNAIGWTFSGNNFYDMPLRGGATESLYKFGPNTKDMTVVGGFNPYGPWNNEMAYPEHISDSGQFLTYINRHSKFEDITCNSMVTSLDGKFNRFHGEVDSAGPSMGIYNTNALSTGETGNVRWNLGRKIGSDYAPSAALETETADDNAARGRLKFMVNSYGTMTEFGRVNENGDWGLGVSSPDTKLHVNGVITATGGNSTQWNTAYASRWSPSTNGIYYDGGNVGIGTYTTIPANAKLAVDGTTESYKDVAVFDGGQLRLRGKTNTNKNLNIGFNTTANKGFIQAQIDNDDYYPLLLNPNGGNVGIGTTNPTNLLTITGIGNTPALGITSSTKECIYALSSPTSTYPSISGHSTLSFGVIGTSSSNVGVYGESSSAEGIMGFSSYVGVKGESRTGTGLYGHSHTGWAGRFEGKMKADTIALTSKLIGTSDSILVREGNYLKYRLLSSLGFGYPGAGIAVSTGSAWGTSIMDNSTNWNTAYGWGNHAGLYLSKTLATDYFYVGNGANVGTAVTMSGDATLVKTGEIRVNKTRLYIRNETGSTIATTKAVYTSGFNNFPLILLADNTNEAKHNVIGLTVGSLPNQSNGYIATSGQCDAETNGWTVGTELYLSTAGSLTSTEPTSGSVYHVGIVTVQANYPTGKILIYKEPEGNTMAAGSAQDLILRLGDNLGVNKISVRNYMNNEFASINSMGNFKVQGQPNPSIEIGSFSQEGIKKLTLSEDNGSQLFDIIRDGDNQNNIIRFSGGPLILDKNGTFDPLAIDTVLLFDNWDGSAHFKNSIYTTGGNSSEWNTVVNKPDSITTPFKNVNGFTYSRHNTPLVLYGYTDTPSSSYSLHGGQSIFEIGEYPEAFKIWSPPLGKTIFNINGDVNPSLQFWPNEGGNVGIGTSNPTNPLHVYSSTVGGLANFTTGMTSANNAGAGFNIYTDDGAAISSGDRLGWMNFGGSKDGAHNLNASVSFAGFAEENFSSTQAGSALAISTQLPGTIGSANRTEKFRITGSGYIGIGTSSPGYFIDALTSTGSATLNLNSTYAIQAGQGTQTLSQLNLSFNSNTYYARSVLRYNRENTHYEYQISLKDPTSTRIVQWVDMTTGDYMLKSGLTNVEFQNTGYTSFGAGGGNVGIGTTAPTEKLGVVGKSAFSDDMKLAGSKKFYFDGGTNDYLYQPSTNVIDFITAGVQRMRFKASNGLVKIGRDTLDDGTYPLSISNDYGSAIASIGVTAWAGTSGSTTFLQKTSGGATVGTFAFNLADKALAGIGSRVSNATGWENTNANKGNFVLKCDGNHSASNYGTYWQFNNTANGSTAAASERFRTDGQGVKITGACLMVKVTATPTLAAGETATYTKGNYYVIAYNDGGTMKYRYFDQTGTANPPVWVYSTTAP